MTKENKQKAKEKMRVYCRIYNKELRRKLIDYVGGPVCCECGCKIDCLLELNHVNGDGAKERKNKLKGSTLYKSLLDNPERRVNYNVLCKVCNINHYVRVVLGFPNFKVTFTET